MIISIYMVHKPKEKHRKVIWGVHMMYKVSFKCIHFSHRSILQAVDRIYYTTSTRQL